MLARRIGELLQPVTVVDDEQWGLDHGTWSVLLKAYPAADIPVVQLSIDGTQPPRFHYDVGRRLKPLRHEGVLIIASGNIVHNLDLCIRSGQNSLIRGPKGSTRLFARGFLIAPGAI